MNTKRWIAIIVAVGLVFVSIGINSLSFLFTRDFSGFMDEMAKMETGLDQTVIEEGVGNSRIAVLTVDGVIQDTGSSPFAQGYNHGQLMEQLDKVLEDDSVEGVVLKVNSPGGGVVESAEIYEGLRKLQTERELPIYVSMGGMAASGGYYISAPADKIFVNHETITGSIGVIMQSMNYAKLAEKYGIDFNTIKTGPYKDIMSGSREMTDEERNMLQEMINDSYDRFVSIISEGRGMSDAAVRKVADGRIMNGRQAIEANLADDYGSVEQVIAAMKKDLKLEDATVFEYSAPDSLRSLLGMKIQSFVNPNFETQLLQKILSENNAPRMMYLYGEH